MKARDLLRFVGYSLMLRLLDYVMPAFVEWPADGNRNAFVAGFITLLYAIREPRP